jgi:hypothetical protein
MIYQSIASRNPIAYLPTAMAIGAANSAVRDLSGALTSNPARRPAVMVAAVIATVSVLVGGWAASRLLARWFRAARNTARFAYSCATLRAFRRCPDCKRLIRADARVCSRCGYREPPKHGRRVRKRAPVKRGRRARNRQPQPAAVA